MSALNEVPLLLRAARGETLERPPVWMMRQAGRYMKAYRDLREKYPSFRERSEIPEVAIQVSLQPWHAFQPDGVILFSDIVTPMPGLGIDMDIAEGKGPIIHAPIRTQQQIDALQPLNPEESLPFIKTILKSLREEVGNKSTVLDDTFALPYQKQVFDQVKKTHPDTPLILLVTGSGGLLERMGKSGADIVSVDWTVDMADARRRLGPNMNVQGNLDPGVSKSVGAGSLLSLNSCK